MQWFKDPQRDSRYDIRAAQQALVHAGYPPAHAQANLAAYLRRVRTALTGAGDAALAGILTVAAMAASVLLMLTLALEVVVRRWGLGGEDFAFDYRHADAPLLPNIMPEAAFALMAFGLLGAGAALGIRRRWRRAGVLRAFRRQPPPRIAPPVCLGAAGLLLLVAGLTVLVGLWLIVAGPVSGVPQVTAFGVYLWSPLLGTLGRALVVLGIPLGAVAFTAWFPVLYAWALPRVSTVDAAAYARPMIEREAARQAADASDFYRRSSYDPGPWADQADRAEREVYRRSFHTRSQPPGTPRRAGRLPGSYRHTRPLPQRLWRYLLLTGGVSIVVWLIALQPVWEYPEAVFTGWYRFYGAPSFRTPELWVVVIGAPTGLALGLGLSWLYARYMEGW